MGTLIHMITVLLCINVMLYLGGFTLLEGDILQEIFDITGDDVTGLRQGEDTLSDAIPSSPLVAGVDTSANDFRLVDIPKTIWAIVLFLLNIMLAPLSLFTSPQLNLPTAFRFMIGVPAALIMIFVIIDWWRGHD